MYTWDFDKYGLTIYDSNGNSCFLQGEEAYVLQEDLDNCENQDIEQMILSEYSELMEPYDDKE